MAAVKIPYRRPMRSGNNSTVGEKVAENIRGGVAQFFGGRRIISIVAVLAGVLIITGSILWYLKIYSSPSRTFSDMLRNNMSTASVTREVIQKSSGTTSDEVSQLTFGPKPMIRDVKEVSNSGKNLSNDIKIESIGTQTDTYQHYVWINQPTAKEKSKANFSKVYSLWVKDGGNGQTSDSSLFNNTIFSGFLFGNLPAAQRTAVAKGMSSAYSVDFQNVKTQVSHGRKTYTYNVILSLKDYAKAAHDYAQGLGLAEAKRIDPNSYPASAKVSMVVSIDVLSRQLRQVVYSSNSSTENYSGYGILANYKLPAQTVSYSTLQKTVEQAASKAK